MAHMTKAERLAVVAARERAMAELAEEFPLGTVAREENGYDDGLGTVTGYQWCEDEGVLRLYVILDGSGTFGTDGGWAALPEELTKVED